jgi:hypothetical protein
MQQYLIFWIKREHKGSKTGIYYFIAGCTGDVKGYETGMGFCFFLVCSRNDCGLSVRRIFEFLCGGDSAGYFLCVVLQVLRIPKKPPMVTSLDFWQQKKEPTEWFFFFFKLSSLNFARSQA